MSATDLCIGDAYIDRIDSTHNTKEVRWWLSDDLLFEMLIRLPTKSLFRFKCVCKRWRYLIACDPSFQARLKLLPPIISGLFYGLCNNDRVNFRSVGHNVENLVEGNLGFIGHSVRVIAAYSGLLLCVENPPPKIGWDPKPRIVSTVYFVCNPLTKQWIALPKLHCHPYFLKSLIYCSQKGFKVFHFEFFIFKPHFVKIKTYSSETGKWQESVLFHPHGHGNMHLLNSTTLIDGRIYFWSEGYRNTPFYIYDLVDESICPKELPLFSTKTFQSGVMVGSEGSVYYAGTDLSGMSIWVLLDGMKWSFLQRITTESLKIPMYSFEDDLIQATSVVLNGKVIFVGSWESTTVLYHLDTGSAEFIINSPLRFASLIVSYSLPACFSVIESRVHDELTGNWIMTERESNSDHQDNELFSYFQNTWHVAFS